MQSCCVANARDTTSHTVFVSPKVRSLGGAPHWEVRVGDIGSARLPERRPLLGFTPRCRRPTHRRGYTIADMEPAASNPLGHRSLDVRI